MLVAATNTITITFTSIFCPFLFGTGKELVEEFSLIFELDLVNTQTIVGEFTHKTIRKNVVRRSGPILLR